MKIRITKNTIMGFRLLKPDEIYEVPAEISQDELKQLKALGHIEEVKKGSNSAGKPSLKISPAPVLYQLAEALHLIENADTIAEIEEVIAGDPREEVLEAADIKKKQLEDELNKEAEK